VAFTAPKTWGLTSVGASDLNIHLRDNTSALRAPPGCKLRLTANQPSAGEAPYAVGWGSGTADWNVGPCWASASGTKLIPSEPGVWRIQPTMSWASGTTGARYVWVRLNGNTDTGTYPVQSIDQHASYITLGGALEYNLATTDYLEVVVRHTNGFGSTLALLGAAAALDHFTAVSFHLVSTVTATSSG
jgi:hypothetical protein